IINIDGTAQSKDGKTVIDFTAVQNLADAAQNKVTVTRAAIPWKGGTLSARNVNVPLTGDKPISFNLQVADLSIDELLRAMTGERVSATGTVGGSLPLTISRKGVITPGNGTLKANSTGAISMPPGLIPGD